MNLLILFAFLIFPSIAKSDCYNPFNQVNDRFEWTYTDAGKSIPDGTIVLLKCKPNHSIYQMDRVHIKCVNGTLQRPQSTSVFQSFSDKFSPSELDTCKEINPSNYCFVSKEENVEGLKLVSVKAGTFHLEKRRRLLMWCQNSFMVRIEVVCSAKSNALELVNKQSKCHNCRVKIGSRRNMVVDRSNLSGEYLLISSSDRNTIVLCDKGFKLKIGNRSLFSQKVTFSCSNENAVFFYESQSSTSINANSSISCEAYVKEDCLIYRQTNYMYNYDCFCILIENSNILASEQAYTALTLYDCDLKIMYFENFPLIWNKGYGKCVEGEFVMRPEIPGELQIFNTTRICFDYLVSSCGLLEDASVFDINEFLIGMKPSTNFKFRCKEHPRNFTIKCGPTGEKTYYNPYYQKVTLNEIIKEDLCTSCFLDLIDSVDDANNTMKATRYLKNDTKMKIRCTDRSKVQGGNNIYSTVDVYCNNSKLQVDGKSDFDYAEVKCLVNGDLDELLETDFLRRNKSNVENLLTISGVIFGILFFLFLISFVVFLIISYYCVVD